MLPNKIGDHSMVWSGMSNMSDMTNVGDKRTATVGSVEGAGRVVDGGDVSSEGLGLGGGPVLTLERLGYGLVGHLASSTVDRGGVDSSVDHRSGNGMSSVDHRGGVGNNRGGVDNCWG